MIFQGGGGVWTPCPPSGSAHDNQGSVLKVLCQTCGNIGDITSKKYAEGKSKTNRDYLKTILLSIRFSHAPRNIFTSKKSCLKSGPKRIKNPIKNAYRSARNSIFSRGRPPNPPYERGSPPIVLSPLSCRRYSMISTAGPLLNTRRRPCK